MEKDTCQNCAHWVPCLDEDENPLLVGYCRIAAEVSYYDRAEEAAKQIPQGKMGGDNIYTHALFGCIHHEKILFSQ